MLVLRRIQLAIQTARSYALPKVAGQDGGAGRAAAVIRWPKVVLVRADITLARKANGAGQTDVRAALGAGAGSFSRGLGFLRSYDLNQILG
jgi:hypothetical protein